MEQGTIIEGEAVPVTSMNLGTLFSIPAVRQILLLIGVAGSVAAGFAIVLWSQTPQHSRLVEGLDSEEVAQVADALRAADIEYTLNMDSGSVTVPESRLHDARLEMASQGLSLSSSVGMNSLGEQAAFGRSAAIENAMYQHALEGELAQTVAHLGAVRDARVHLALPKRSSFIVDSNAASASVFLTLYRGRELEQSQVASIVHMVASSIPNLATSDVTVIDQNGRLLSSGDDDWTDIATAKHYEITERLEESYKHNIEALLTPILGPDRISAQVVADMDFTVSEEMLESFDPSGAVISEHISENQRNADESAATGVPGALSNQPPEAGGNAGNDATQADATQKILDSTSESTRNYENNRSIRRIQPTAGRIQRLSVAVVVDDTPIISDVEEGEAAEAATTEASDDGAPATETSADNTSSLTDEDMERITALVKQAVGFDEARGDTVTIFKTPFHAAPELEPAEEIAFWAKPSFIDTMKQVLGAVIVLALAFGLVRPFLRSLIAANEVSSATQAVAAGAAPALPVGANQLPATTAQLGLPSFDEKVAAAKKISGHDPAKVAQVVKQWVESGDSG